MLLQLSFPFLYPRSNDFINEMDQSHWSISYLVSPGPMNQFTDDLWLFPAFQPPLKSSLGTIILFPKASLILGTLLPNIGGSTLKIPKSQDSVTWVMARSSELTWDELLLLRWVEGLAFLIGLVLSDPKSSSSSEEPEPFSLSEFKASSSSEELDELIESLIKKLWIKH